MSIPAVIWSDAERQRAFETWFHTLAPQFGLDVASLRMASADASFRRYLRVNAFKQRVLPQIIQQQKTMLLVPMQNLGHFQPGFGHQLGNLHKGL